MPLGRPNADRLERRTLVPIAVLIVFGCGKYMFILICTIFLLLLSLLWFSQSISCQTQLQAVLWLNWGWDNFLHWNSWIKLFFSIIWTQYTEQKRPNLIRPEMIFFFLYKKMPKYIKQIILLLKLKAIIWWWEYNSDFLEVVVKYLVKKNFVTKI